MYRKAGRNKVRKQYRFYPLILSAVLMCTTAFSACADAAGPSSSAAVAAASSATEDTEEVTTASALSVSTDTEAAASASASSASTGTEAAASASVSSVSADTEAVSAASGTSEQGTADRQEVDGYTFSWSGGSGRAVITCKKISEQDGQLYAVIHFSRANGGTSSYTEVQAGGQTVSGDNTFTIPVNSDANTEIQALTTAMSQPHWITYVLYIAKSSGAADEGLSGDALDASAPEIPGLTAEEAAVNMDSDLLRIFSYDHDVHLIEVDMVKNTARGNSTQGDSQNTEDSQDAGQDAASSTAVYLQNVVKYLVVPEDYDVPAGLDKEAVIIRRPVERAFITSPEALQMISDLGRTEDVLALGMDENDISDGTIKAALEKNSDSEGKIYQAGTYNDWDLKTLILQKTDLAVESAEILPQDAENAEEDMQTFEKLVSRAGQMDMPVFTDRSRDETSDLARAEWYRAYGILFDSEDRGEELYQELAGKTGQ